MRWIRDGKIITPGEFIPVLETGNSICVLDFHIFEQVCRAVLHAYDISRDDRRLRSAPQDFEKLRGNYPVRREFPFFRVRGGTPEALKVLTSLGFSTDGGEK